MPIDVGIYNGLMQPQRSAIDYANEYARADAMRNQNALMGMQVQQAAQANAGAMGVRNALSTMKPDATVDDTINMLRHMGTPEALSQAEKLDTANQNRIKIGADAALANANAAQTTQNTGFARRDKALRDIASFDSPQQALASLQAHAAAGDIDPVKAQAIAQSLQQIQDPGTFARWQVGMLKGILNAPEAVKYATPDANTVLQSDTSAANNASNNATSRANVAAQQAGEDRRANQSRGTQLLIAGVNPDGSLAGNTSALVDQLGKYDINPTLALQRLPLGQRSALVAQVQAKYPGWDETQYDAKKGAAQKFAYGDLGNALRSVSTANAHLDQLGELVDALGNGNIPLVNKVGNLYAQQTGSPAPTNFDAVKNVIGQEVVKAIVAGGGSAGERDEASRAFSNASSPAQLKGAIQHYRQIMGAQQANLLEQRRAAGLPESTLPNYGGAAPGQHPPDITAILNQYGVK
jgi:hypothetical protein